MGVKRREGDFFFFFLLTLHPPESLQVHLSAQPRWTPSPDNCHYETTVKHSHRAERGTKQKRQIKRNIHMQQESQESNFLKKYILL